MHIYSITEAEIQREINTAKDYLAQVLFKDGVISQEALDMIKTKYQVLVRARGSFGKFFDKIFPFDKDVPYKFVVVKIVNDE